MKPDREKGLLSDTKAGWSLHADGGEAGEALLAHSSGWRRKLYRNGMPREALRVGWSATGIVTLFAPNVVISLEHDDGRLARWIVDPFGETYDEPLDRIPDRIRRHLRSVTSQLLPTRNECEPAKLAAWNLIPRPARLELLADAECRWIESAGPVLPASTEQNFITIIRPDRLEVPVLVGGRPLRQEGLQPGWNAVGLYRDFSPFFLLELVHVSGQTATWVLDHRLNYIGDVTGLSADTKDALCLRARPIMERHLATILALADPDPEVDRYIQLNNDVRSVLVLHCGDSIRPALYPLALRDVPALLPACTDREPGKALDLDKAAITLALKTDLHKQSLAAIETGRLEWPSPVDGSLSPLQGIFTLSDYAFLYQFTDRNGLDFIIIASDRCCRAIGLVVPTLNLLLFDENADSEAAGDWIDKNLGEPFWLLLVRHINRYARETASRRRSRSARLVNVLLALHLVHIGHHLWNDLSGIDALCRVIPADRLPTTMILGAADGSAELFGPIDSLFPEMAGHIDRSLPDVDGFIRWTYDNDVWPTRITREYISEGLRQRVMNRAALDPGTAPLRSRIAGLRHAQPRAPMIVFGLRVEDRTFVDPVAFCDAFVAFVADRHPGSTIILDGYNARPGQEANSGVIAGMVSHLARRPPEQIEQELVEGLSRRFAAAPVTVIGTTGQSIATSLTWCGHADVAFALWGAGLAKIRWLANLPTMIVTSRLNLQERPDLGIYHDPKFMAVSAPVRTVDPALVSDAPEHTALASGFIQGGRECFHVETDAVLAAFGVFLDSLGWAG